MMDEIIPILVSVFKLKASSCPYYKKIGDDDLNGLCAAMLDLLSIKMAPSSLDQQGDVVTIIRGLILQNLIINGCNYDKYYFHLNGLVRYTEANGHEWRKSTILYASKVLTPRAPIFESPAEGLAADLRDYIMIAITNDYEIVTN